MYNKKFFYVFIIVLYIFFSIFLKNSYAMESTTPPKILSKAAVVIDRKTGMILYEKNCNEVRKMASTTKIMTAIIVLENTPDLSKTVTVSKKTASVGGSVLGLRTNDKITINDLLFGLMLKSGNDTAVVY